MNFIKYNLESKQLFKLIFSINVSISYATFKNNNNSI